MDFKNFISALFIVYLLSIGATCKKNCQEISYTFSSGVVVIPDYDSLVINDTFWIRANIPTQLIDLNTNSNVNFSNASNLSVVIKAIKFIGGSTSNPGSIEANSDFNFKLTEGQVLPNSRLGVIAEIKPYEESGFYRFSVGIIPKSRGTFALGIDDARNVLKNGSNCENAFFGIVFLNTNQHLYLYQQNRPGYQISDYERTHMYCFKVY